MSLGVAAEGTVGMPVSCVAGMGKARKQAGMDRYPGSPLFHPASPCTPVVDTGDGEGPGLEFLVLVCGMCMFCRS